MCALPKCPGPTGNVLTLFSEETRISSSGHLPEMAVTSRALRAIGTTLPVAKTTGCVTVITHTKVAEMPQGTGVPATTARLLIVRNAVETSLVVPAHFETINAKSKLLLYG